MSNDMDTEDAGTMLKNRLKETIQRYYVQLTQGCGRTRCENPYCNSNPRKDRNLDPVVLSFQLAKKEATMFCSPVPPHLTWLLTKQKVENAIEQDNLKPVIREFGNILSNSESVNESFLSPSNLAEDSPTNDFGLEDESLEKFYTFIQQWPPLVGPVLFAQEGLVSNLRYTAAQCNSPKSLRQLIVLLKNPWLGDPANYKTILGPLCVGLSHLPRTSQELLVQWLARLPTNKLRQLLGHLQQFISLRILTQASTSLNGDDHIVATTKVMQLLYHANELSRKLDYKEFYNDVITENIDLREDFINWIAKDKFSFCQYPFILHPIVKSKVLQIESHTQMRRERQEAFRQLVYGAPFIPILGIKVHRENLLEDSLMQLSRYPPEDLKKELRVYFVGEEAVDEGGVRKEWFQLVVRDIFDPKYGMFIHKQDTRTYWFNSNSTDFLDFQLIGMLLGLAIYNGIILDVHFPLVVYKKLCNLTPTVDDLFQIDAALAVGLQKLLAFEGDVEAVFGHTFQIQYEYFGEKRVYDLKEGGEHIALTNANREEYVQLYVKYLLEDSVKQQFDSFAKGFRLLCDSPGFRLFRAEELELLICGSDALDFEALEKSTIYENGFSHDHPLIRNFWEIVHSMTLEEKKMLLFFSTGSDRSPIGGLGNLGFVIVRHGPDSDRLPTAHTCFNHLLIPEYSSKEKLKERLLTALRNAEGFGML